VRPLKGSVVVKQSARVHRAIQRFLTQLDPEPRQVAAAAQPAANPSGAAISPDPFRVLKSPAPSATGNPLRRKKTTF
jgi:hypothetical protein